MNNNFTRKNILIQNYIIKKKRKHKNKKEWITIYYYVDKKRCKAIVNENVCSSKVELRRNCLYKISNLLFTIIKLLK